MPNDKILAQLCALSGDDVAVMAANVQAARAQSDEGRTLWENIAARLRGGATTAILSVLFTIGLIAAPADSARAGEVWQSQSVWVKNLYIVCSDILSVGRFALVRLRQFGRFSRLRFGVLI